MTPFFSVVIPCRDRRRLLGRALASLSRQSFTDFETIVVDDGSAEDLRPVTDAFPHLKVRLLATGGKGANAARNLGTDAAKADWVCYLDSDDAFLPDRLAGAARRLSAEPGADMLVSAGYVWRAGGAVEVKPRREMAVGEDIGEFYFADGERFLTSGWVVRRSVAQAVRWDERLKKVQDPDFIIRLVRAGYRLAYAPEPAVVLFDDVQAGRISDSVVLENLRDWLARSGDMLTPRARAGFEVYALAYEARRAGVRHGLGHVLRAAGRAPLKLTAKSLFRLAVPVQVFKAAARLASGMRRGGDGAGELAAYLASLEAAAMSALGQAG